MCCKIKFLCTCVETCVVCRSVVPNLFSISLPPPYLKLFFTSFTFEMIQHHEHTTKKLNNVMCNVKRNTAVAIYVKISRLLFGVQQFESPVILHKRRQFFFLANNNHRKNRLRMNSTSFISLCSPHLICDFTPAREVGLPGWEPQVQIIIFDLFSTLAPCDVIFGGYSE